MIVLPSLVVTDITRTGAKNYPQVVTPVDETTSWAVNCRPIVN